MTTEPHRINVLFVVHSLGLGGAERVVVDLARNLDRERYDVSVCVFSEVEGWASELDGTGVALHVLEKRSRFDVFLVLRLVQLIRKLRPDVISMHCRDALHFGTLASLLTRVPRRIATEHSTGPGTNQLLNAMAYRLSVATWHATVAVSEYMRDFMVSRWGLPRSRIRVIHNGVDFSRLDPGFGRDRVKKELRLPLETRLVGNAGTLKTEKGHASFLKIASRVAAVDPAVHFVIIGAGSLRNELSAITRNLGIQDRVHLMGPRKDLAHLLCGMDVFLCTSQVETFGLAVVEAMFLGVPVVAFGVGSLAEIVSSGKDGFLVEYGDHAGAAERILALLEDSVLSDAIRCAARESVVQRFSVQRMVAGYEELFSLG